MFGPLAYEGRYVRWRVYLRGTNHSISISDLQVSVGVISPYISFSTRQSHLDSQNSLPDILFPAKLDKVLIYHPVSARMEIVMAARLSALGVDHTLEFVLADVNEARRLDDLGGEVVDHYGTLS